MTKLLVMGAGLIGSRHIRHIIAHSACELAGIIEPDASKCSEFDAPVFKNIEAVDVDVDGVVIATPTQVHKDNALDAAKKGWHMLIEKPVAASLSEADEIIRAAKSAKVGTLIGHHRRHHPRVKLLRKTLKSGVIGTPILANLIWALRKPDSYFENNWRSGSDGSPVLINLVHDIDLLRFLFGEISGVSGFGTNTIRNKERVENGVLSFAFDNGTVASVTFSDRASSPWAFEAGTGENPNIAFSGQDMMWISGAEGSISFPSLTLWNNAPDWSQLPDSAIFEYNDDSKPLENQLSHFVDIIENGAKPLIDAADARATLAITLKAQETVSKFI